MGRGEEWEEGGSGAVDALVKNTVRFKDGSVTSCAGDCDTLLHREAGIAPLQHPTRKDGHTFVLFAWPSRTKRVLDAA